MKKTFLVIFLIVFSVTVGYLVQSAFSANEVTSRTWYLDTTGSIATNPVEIEWIMPIGLTSNAMDIVLRESSSGELIIPFLGIGTPDNGKPIYFSPGNRLVPGVYLSTLENGYVVIRTR